MSAFEDIQKAKSLIASNNRVEARQVLSALVQSEPSNAQAWYLLSFVVETKDQVIYCIDRAMKLDPLNQEIRERGRAFQTQDQKKQAPSPVATASTVGSSQAQPRKNKASPVSTAITILFVFFLLYLLFDFISAAGKSNVKYVVNGSANSAFITYANKQGGTEQINVYLPFEITYSSTSTDFLYISAINDGGGSLTCEIWVNGTLKKTSTSTAEFGFVDCTE